MKKSINPNTFARDLRAFFAEYVPLTRGLSSNTLLSYRDAFKLLLRFLEVHCGCSVVDLDFAHVTPEAVIAFLDYLETERHNGPSTRNARLAAIHSFARFSASLHPEHLEQCQRLLAIPTKRARTKVIEYLEGQEVGAMLDSVDRTTADGRRDHTLIVTFFNSGARVQEFLDTRPADLQLARPLQMFLRGKGRKERLCPLWPETADLLKGLIRETGLSEDSTEPLFRNHCGEPLTRSGVRYILRKYAALASSKVPSLARKRVHPHTLRHSAAVHMLQAGVDLVTISFWLGHASVVVTNRYAAVDLETKRAAVAKAGSIVEGAETLRAWREDESILTWLESL